MALTRKFLTAMGIDGDKIDQIIEAHADTVNALKEERDKYKSDAELLPDVQKQLEQAQKDLAANGEDPYKAKYEALNDEFETFKAEIFLKETVKAKEEAYTSLLKEAGVSEKRISAILKVTNLDSEELTNDGILKSRDKLLEEIKNEWSDFIVTEGQQGADSANPPQSGVRTDMTKEVYEAMPLSERMTFANSHPDVVSQFEAK